MVRRISAPDPTGPALSQLLPLLLLYYHFSARECQASKRRPIFSILDFELDSFPSARKLALIPFSPPFAALS
jgi:hypothetical protein